jgi:hypothetical protein
MASSIDYGSAFSTANHPSATSWEDAEFRVNGKVIPSGSPFVLPGGMESVITVKATHIAQLRAVLVDAGGMQLSADPPFGELFPVVGGMFCCTLTPGAGQTGSATLVFFSPDVVLPLEVTIEVVSASSEIFTFIDSSGAPLPVPPDKYQLPASTPVERVAVILTNAQGEPLANVPGKFFHPDMSDFAYRTNASGRVNLWVQNNDYPVGDVFEVRAVVELPGAEKEIKLLVEVL